MSDREPSDSTAGETRRQWPRWVMSGVFAFLAFECLLLAAVMKGAWLILVVPAIVCGIKARETWVQLKK